MYQLVKKHVGRNKIQFTIWNNKTGEIYKRKTEVCKKVEDIAPTIKKWDDLYESLTA